MNSISHKVIVVLVFIMEDEKILLVRQNYGEMFWSLPGGIVDGGESLIDAAVREVKEETSLDISINRVVGIYDKPEVDAVAITLEGHIIAGNISPDNEIIECAFFSPDDFPDHIREHFHQRVADYLDSSCKVFVRTQ